MDASVPVGGSGSSGIVQSATGAAGNAVGSVTATFASTPTPGNTLIAALIKRGTGVFGGVPSGWTKHDVDVASPAFDGGRIGLYYKVAGASEPTAHTFSSVDVKRLYIAEWGGLIAPVGTSGVGWSEVSNTAAHTFQATASITPAVTPLVLFAGFVQAARTPNLVLPSPFAEDYDVDVDPSGPGAVFGHRIVDPASGAYTVTATSSHTKGWGAFMAAFSAASGGITWANAPDTVDDDDGTSDDVLDSAIAATGGPFWRGVLDGTQLVSGITALIGFENTGSVTMLLQGATQADYSDATDIAVLNATATGSLTGDDFAVVFDEHGPYEFWQLVLDSSAQDVRVYEVFLDESPEGPGPTVPPGQEPAKAILEIYVHDEDASRWGVATWATGPATGTEGIWSAAGWTDITPEGVQAHILWGARRPERGILATQDGGSWNVETYDPDRILDPGNFDSPYYPQLLPGLPIRISHDSLVIRTGYVDEMRYNQKRPFYQGQILATDTIALLNQSQVPSDSVLGDTLLERIQDAINAAGIAVGGIPLPPGGPAGPAIAPLDTDNPRERSVWDHVQTAALEVLWVVYVDAAAGIGMRPWGAPLDRGRDISAPNLEDLASLISEDGMYSVARVQGDDPDVPPIEREATPLPRYGRRVIERTELTVDPEGWADAVLAERAWAGVQYVPGTIHCFTRADVDYFGSLEIMERVTITVPGVVSVTGRVLGGELFVEHTAKSTRGAKWQFIFAVATDGSSAVGLTTLVADGTGDTLLDDMTGTDYLEAD